MITYIDIIIMIIIITLVHKFIYLIIVILNFKLPLNHITHVTHFGLGVGSRKHNIKLMLRSFSSDQDKYDLVHLMLLHEIPFILLF